MIPKECKRIIEVDFPIAKVSSAVLKREKKFPVPRGLPSTLHHWWARRPFGSSRAILLAMLLPDPCDPNCPKDFREKAWKILNPISESEPRDSIAVLRAILDFIADFSSWENSSKEEYLIKSRNLIKAAHGDERPHVVDPFAGGGSIPLEALRLGCDTFASDLNPVACLIVKTMLEDIPRFGPELANTFFRIGTEVKEAAEKELVEFYPIDPDGARPIAYLWARTVRCEAPNCGAETPLMRSFWLCKKNNRNRSLRPKIIRPEGKTPYVEFEIFEPKSEKEVPPGTVTRAKATCLCCNAVLSPERVRAQLSVQHGGADVIFDEKGHRIGGAMLLAVVILNPTNRGRAYRLSTERDYLAIWKAQNRLKKSLGEWERGGKKGLCPVPDEPTPAGGGSGAGRAFSVQKYGMMTFGDLFAARQKLALLTIGKIIATNYTGNAQKKSCAELLALALDKVADFNCSLAKWRATNEDVGDLFSRQALPIVWDFAETNLAGSSYVDFGRVIDHIAEVVNYISRSTRIVGQVQISDACQCHLPNESTSIYFTDPPYYDAIPYADLSDFFFVWLKRTLPGHPMLRDPFDPNNLLTPKIREAVQDEVKRINDKPKDRAFFEAAMTKAFTEGRRILKNEGIGCIIFAHKTTEGWEALLSGIIKGGWVVTASWPIATEMGSRLRARDSAALATSIHLVCRPRPEDAPVGDWAEVLRELPGRVGDWMERLQAEHVRGADLVFACIGPALEIFSRYSKAETADGREVKLAEYLEKVWEVVGRTALEHVLGTAEAKARNGAAGALEEDARLTALFLWTLQVTERSDNNGNKIEAVDEIDEDEDDEAISGKVKKGYSLIYDVVRRFAQPLGIHLDQWEGRIIETEKGIVRLLSVSERAEQLFGAEGASAVAKNIEEHAGGPIQLTLFMEATKAAAPEIKIGKRGRKGTTASEELKTHYDATTLDRVHAAMLLQAGGQTNALRALISSEQERGPEFLRLANALSALYPKGSEEKRLLDAMLLVVPRY